MTTIVQDKPAQPAVPLPPPVGVRQRLNLLAAKKQALEERSMRLAREFVRLNPYLEIVDKVTEALKQLSDQLFRQLLAIVQEKLTIALQEILEQPIKFQAEADFKRRAAWVDFWIEHDGHREDVLKGQGGSVANILSVGLRMFALMKLDDKVHRRFLVLDEQDCWLRPDLVPRLVKIVREAGQALGFQVLMISHHDVGIFEQYADKIYQFVPRGADGVEVRLLNAAPPTVDR